MEIDEVLIVLLYSPTTKHTPRHHPLFPFPPRRLYLSTINHQSITINHESTTASFPRVYSDVPTFR